MFEFPPRGSVEALLLDMDGTIVDSHAAVERGWSQWAQEQGAPAADVLAVCHGVAPGATIRRFRPDLDAAEVDRQVAEHLRRETVDLEGVVAAPGALRLIEAIAAAGIPWAVVTNASRELATARMGAAGIHPPMLVGLDDVAAGKPAPDAYEEAARRLGVDVTRCIAVEDSETGLASARAAGAAAFEIGPDAGSLDDLTDWIESSRSGTGTGIATP
ncbi:MAG: HAD-IA family hydrolase [Dermatophilus congolensis]|nr:HAD-IA family hydrolase [Dermatophilus congolensis]